MRILAGDELLGPCFWDRIESAINQGIDSSKGVLGKAKERAKDLGERGVLKFDLMQLERQSMRLMGKLGNEVCGPAPAGIKELITELADIEQRIDEKDQALKQLSD